MTVAELKRKLDEFPDHLEVVFKTFDLDDFRLYGIDNVDRKQAGSRHFVMLEG